MSRVRISRAWVCLAFSFLFNPARASADDSCAIKQFRWMEDCSDLRGRPLSSLEQLRYLPLDDAGATWLTLGGEYRLKIESLDAPDFDVRPVDKAFTAIGHRWLLHADLRTRVGIRFFVQFSAAAENGRRPIERPFDRSSVDVAQAFVDIPLPMFDSTILRAGRQELDAGGNRLISVREAANLRRAFDMIHLESRYRGFDAVAFYGRPVLNREGAFDDHDVPGEFFYGGWITGSLGDALKPTVFFLARDRQLAVYQQGAAPERRRTVGLRLAASDARFDYATQAAYQFGSFGAAKIRAYGVAADLGWHPDWWGHPRFGASFGVASGDARPGDRTLGTFDVLYPNLGYFTDAPVFYPGNTADLQPNVTLNPLSGISLHAGTDFIWRISDRDAVYAPPGVPLVLGNGTGPSFVTALSFLRADWTPDPHVTISISGVHGFASGVIATAGGRDFNYGSISTDLHL